MSRDAKASKVETGGLAYLVGESGCAQPSGSAVGLHADMQNVIHCDLFAFLSRIPLCSAHAEVAHVIPRFVWLCSSHTSLPPARILSACSSWSRTPRCSTWSASARGSRRTRARSLSSLTTCTAPAAATSRYTAWPESPVARARGFCCFCWSSACLLLLLLGHVETLGRRLILLFAVVSPSQKTAENPQRRAHGGAQASGLAGVPQHQHGLQLPRRQARAQCQEPGPAHCPPQGSQGARTYVDSSNISSYQRVWVAVLLVGGLGLDPTLSLIHI